MLKKLTILSLFVIICTTLFVFYANRKIESYSKLCYSNIDDIPSNKVGLVLGTIKHLGDGRVNHFYQARVDAAIKLYEKGKIEYVLVSGDNSRKAYNEPEAFKEDLMKAGIPENKIFLDFAGFRTLDSVVRAKEIFGQTKFTIISQPFHNERALYLADKNNLNAVAFNAKDYSGNLAKKVKVREKLAKVKAMLDINILGTQPKYLGEKIEIN